MQTYRYGKRILDRDDTSDRAVPGSPEPVHVHPQAHYRGLRRLVALQMILVSLVPLLVVCTIIGLSLGGLYQGRSTRLLEETAARKALEIDLFLADRGAPSPPSPSALKDLDGLVASFRLGESGIAFVVAPDGSILAGSPGASLPDHCLAPLLKELGGRPGPVTLVCAPGGAGREVFVAARLARLDGALVFRQLADEARQDLNTVLFASAVVLALGVGVILTLSLLVSHILVERLRTVDREKELMQEQIVRAGRLASLGELAAGIAHEINNPVAIMAEEAGWIDDILTEGEAACNPENLREITRSVAQIRTQSRRCKDITHKLLSFARRTDPTVESLNLNGLVEDMVSLARKRAKFSEAAIRTALDPSLPPLLASATEMQQVLLNLVNNSIDALPEKGGEVVVTTRSEDGRIVLEVSDNGAGIPREHLDNIFDPFFTTKPVGKGTGLGLSIVYGIVHKLGGTIEVASEAGRGTTIRVLLPLRRKTDPGPASNPQSVEDEEKDLARPGE